MFSFFCISLHLSTLSFCYLFVHSVSCHQLFFQLFMVIFNFIYPEVCAALPFFPFSALFEKLLVPAVWSQLLLQLVVQNDHLISTFAFSFLKKKIFSLFAWQLKILRSLFLMSCEKFMLCFLFIRSSCSSYHFFYQCIPFCSYRFKPFAQYRRKVC